MSKSHDTVAHEWAHQAARGNAANGHHMFYAEDTIYSYGLHFPIARLVTVKGGAQCVLFTTRRYSVSTAKHITITRRACSHLLTFDVPFVGLREKHSENMASYRDELKKSLDRASRRRSASNAVYDLEQCEKLCDDASAYAKWFKLDRRKLAFRAPTMPSDIGERLETLREAHKRELLAQKVKREERDAEIERDIIPRWHNGEAVAIPYDYSSNGVYLLRVMGDTIETSGNARFTVSDALILWPILQRLRSILKSETGAVAVAAWINKRELPKLGFYQIDSVTTVGVRAGCHLVEWQEIDAVADKLGLL